MFPRSLTLLTVLGVVSLGWPSKAVAQKSETTGRAQGQPASALLSDDARVEKAITLYQSGEYGHCASELSALLDGEPTLRIHDASALEKGRLWLATCLIGDGQPAKAETVLEATLRARPGMRAPDPLTFPRALVDLFIQAQDRLRFMLQEDEEKRIAAARQQTDQAQVDASLESKRVERLELFATTERVVHENHRFIAALPFGVGQFQNGKDGLGWVLLSSEIVLSGAALVSTVAFVNLQTKGVNALNSRSSATEQAFLSSQVNRDLRAWYTVATVSSYGFAAVALGGILESQLNFVPEVSFPRRRELPKNLRRSKGEAARRAQATVLQLSPRLLATETQVYVGVSGKF